LAQTVGFVGYTAPLASQAYVNFSPVHAYTARTSSRHATAVFSKVVAQFCLHVVTKLVAVALQFAAACLSQFDSHVAGFFSSSSPQPASAAAAIRHAQIARAAASCGERRGRLQLRSRRFIFMFGERMSDASH